MAERPEFAEFVAARTPALLRTARLLTGDWTSGEDLLQESLTKCWRRWSRIDGNPEPYVRRVMVTTYLAWSRRFWNRERVTGDLPDLPVEDVTTRLADQHEMEAALNALPRGQRAVVVLRYFDDLTEAQTAEMLGVSVGTVKSQTSKALAALRIDAAAAAHDQQSEVN